jgi:hypothetical protein
VKKSDLLLLPGIGRTFQRDFARIGLLSLADFKGKDPELLFEQLREANAREEHATSKNYLYVLRYVVYCADTPPGRREASLMKWSAWKD